MEEAWELAIVSFSKSTETFLETNHFLIRLHLIELKFRIEKSFTNFARINSVLEFREGLQDGDNRHVDTSKALFAAIHDFVSAVGFVSTMLNPSSPKKNPSENRETFKVRSKLTTGRGSVLLELSGLSDDDVVMNRKLRNRLTHFDEDLDQWYLRSKNKPMVRNVIAPIDKKFDDVKAEDVFERFDPETAVYYFQEEAFDLQKIADGLSKLRKNLCNRSADLINYQIQVMS